MNSNAPKDVAEWCKRSLEEAKQTGNFDTRCFVQNAQLIIDALSFYEVPSTIFKKCGHPKTEKNTRWKKTGAKQNRYRCCRRCETNRRKKKYATDPEYKARVLATAKAWNEKRRKEQ